MILYEWQFRHSATAGINPNDVAGASPNVVLLDSHVHSFAVVSEHHCVDGEGADGGSFGHDRARGLLPGCRIVNSHRLVAKAQSESGQVWANGKTFHPHFYLWRVMLDKLFACDAVYQDKPSVAQKRDGLVIAFEVESRHVA